MSPRFIAFVLVEIPALAAVAGAAFVFLKCTGCI